MAAQCTDSSALVAAVDELKKATVAAGVSVNDRQARAQCAGMYVAFWMFCGPENDREALTHIPPSIHPSHPPAHPIPPIHSIPAHRPCFSDRSVHSPLLRLRSVGYSEYSGYRRWRRVPSQRTRCRVVRAAQALSAAFRSLEAAPVGKAYAPVVEAAQAMVEALLAKETNEEVRPSKASCA